MVFGEGVNFLKGVKLRTRSGYFAPYRETAQLKRLP